jgi:hypothetical protein
VDLQRRRLIHDDKIVRLIHHSESRINRAQHGPALKPRTVRAKHCLSAAAPRCVLKQSFPHKFRPILQKRNAKRVSFSSFGKSNAPDERHLAHLKIQMPQTGVV